MDLDGKFSPPRLSFCTRRDPSGAEFVLLDTGDDLLPPSRAVEDRTGYEAVLNHVHLFSGPLPPEELAEVRTRALAGICAMPWSRRSRASASPSS